MQQEKQQPFIFSSPCVGDLPFNPGHAQCKRWAPSWGPPQPSLNWSETSPASSPAAKTLLQIYLDFTKFWKLLSAKPWLQEKSVITAQWLELLLTSKAQLLVHFISILMYRHSQMPESHWDVLFALSLLYLILSLWKYPCVTLLRVLALSWSK